jgi:competence protein ComEC
MAAGAGALAGVAFGWWGAAAVAAAAVLILAAWPRDRFVRAACLVTIVAAVIGVLRVNHGGVAARIDDALAYGDTAMVTTAPVATGQRQYFVAQFGGARDDAEVGRVCITAPAHPVARVGDEVRLGGEIRAASDVALALRAYLAGRGCDASMFATWLQVVESASSPARALADVRSRIGEGLRRSAPGDAGVLLSGLVTGDDAGFSAARQEAFNRTGTTHLTAVSGSNLALVAGMLAAIGGVTVGRHRVAWQIATVAVVWAYAAISGAEAPALRAAIVATAAIFAFRFGRRPDFATLVILAAGAMALLDPGRVESLGFRLSVAASLALAVVLPPLAARGRGSGIAAVVVATVAAQVATLPFLLPIFGAMSLTSVPANVIAAPLAAAAMPLAGLAGLAGLVWQPLAEPLAAPALVAANGLIAAVDFLGAPRAYVSVGVPPVAATAIMAMSGCALLAVLMNDKARIAALSPLMASRAADHPADEAGGLPSAASLVFAGEDPLDALGADPDHAEEEPTGEEDRHEVADKREVAETVPRQIARQHPDSHS